MSGSLTRGGRENVPDVPDACVNCAFTYLARVPLCRGTIPSQNTRYPRIAYIYHWRYYLPPLVCWRGYRNLSTLSNAIPRAAEVQAWYCDAKRCKFPYSRQQTRGNEFIPCSNKICDILKRFITFKIPATTLIWPKSPCKHSVTQPYHSGKESGRRSESPMWRHQWRSFVLISHADDVKHEIRLYTPPSKSLASLWLAGQLVVIPLLKWPYFQKYHTEYFKISYDKC